jgi:eukaryotic-like serine/threonine-protein kinase
MNGPPMEKRLNPEVPKKIGKYDILDVLGHGGMGIVYRARDAMLGRQVAIKKLTEGYRGNPEMLRRFYEEANRHAALSHNNIVTVYDAAEHEGEPYIVMQFIEGEPLDKTLKERGRLRPQAAMNVIEQVCVALAYAHRKGVIHRDVKPANIIVQPDGTAKLFDFGIARDEIRLQQTATHTGTLVGTPHYMAPERWRGIKIDGRSDIFSVGVLFYQLLTGNLPFPAEYPGVIDQIMTLDPPPPSTVTPDCPVTVDPVVARALAKSPAQRYQNAEDMALDLQEVAEGITRAHIAELMAEAEAHIRDQEFETAQSVLREVVRQDTQNVAGKRLLLFVDQRLAELERERKAQDLGRQARQAASSRNWERALALVEEGLGLNPESPTLVALRKSVMESKQIQDRVAQLLQESIRARQAGELARAQKHAASAQQLDPQNSQVLALCIALEREIEERRLKQELRTTLASALEHLAAEEFDEASHLLDQAESISPDNVEVLLAKDHLALALSERRRKEIVRRLEEKVALTTTLDKLRAVSEELTKAINEFPVDHTLLRLRMELEPRIRQLEDESIVREACRKARELPPGEAIGVLREALLRVPGNDQLAAMELALTNRIGRKAQEQLVGERLGLARKAIDDRLYLEAVKILEGCKAEGISSYEVDGLLQFARSAASQSKSQELLSQTHSQATRLMEGEDYGQVVDLLRQTLRRVDEPVLRRQLEEATQKQLATEQRAESSLEQAGKLMDIGLFTEALLLLEMQPVAVRKQPRVEEALARAKKLRVDEGDFARSIGRCYAMLGMGGGAGELKKLLNTPPSGDAPSSQEELKRRLRQRAEEIYGVKASSAISSARESLVREDTKAVDAALQDSTRWFELAPSRSQEELRALQTEAAAARKSSRRGAWRE